jgi:hypothetical protein
MLRTTSRAQSPGMAVVDIQGIPLEQMLLLAEAITAPLPAVSDGAKPGQPG